MWPPVAEQAEMTGCATGTPAADDASCNNVDDDCNGATDEDYVADSSCFLPGACAAGNVASSCGAGGNEWRVRRGRRQPMMRAATM